MNWKNPKKEQPNYGEEIIVAMGKRLLIGKVDTWNNKILMKPDIRARTTYYINQWDAWTYVSDIPLPDTN
jgi:hypothetical protein